MSREDALFYDPPLYEKYVFEKVIMSLSGHKCLRSGDVIMINNLFFTSVWFQNEEFRDWILKKLIQGEQACHRAPNFAKLHVSIDQNKCFNLHYWYPCDRLPFNPMEGGR